MSAAAAPGHPPASMSLATARSLALLALASGFACTRAAPEDFPGMRLLARVEARLERDQAALKPMLTHYGLVFPVEPADLDAFMRQIRVHGQGPDLALGTEYRLELHGGGLLRLLFDFWRPDSRGPRLGDRYGFEANQREISLGQLYEAGRLQVFLPVPGRSAGATGDALPDSPQLPRMWLRFRLPGGPVRSVELDSYKFLSLLIELEPDSSRAWVNRTGQRLSVDLLMRNVREHYLRSGANLIDPEDHSNLHLVELLVAFASTCPGAVQPSTRQGAVERSDRAARDLEPIQQHFLTGELAPHALDPADAATLLTHTVESLGHLLEASELAWSEAEKRRVRSWLEELEEDRFRDVASLDLESLSHLAKGLRSVAAHRGELE